MSQLVTLYPAVFSKAKNREMLSQILGENRQTPMIDFTENANGMGQYGRLDEFKESLDASRFLIVGAALEVLGIVCWNNALEGFYLIERIIR